MTLRVVLDTNVLVAAAYHKGSASARLVDACLNGRLTAVVSPALRREYETILRRAVRVSGGLERIAALVGSAVEVDPGPAERVVEADPDDDALFAAALAAGAFAVVSSDRAVCEVGAYQGIVVLRPTEAAVRLLGGLPSGSEEL